MFLLPNSLAETSITRLKRSGEVRPPCLVPDLKERIQSFTIKYEISWGFPMVLVAKYLPSNAGDGRDLGLIPESGRSRGGGHANLL